MEHFSAFLAGILLVAIWSAPVSGSALSAQCHVPFVSCVQLATALLKVVQMPVQDAEATRVAEGHVDTHSVIQNSCLSRDSIHACGELFKERCAAEMEANPHIKENFNKFRAEHLKTVANCPPTSPN